MRGSAKKGKRGSNKAARCMEMALIYFMADGLDRTLPTGSFLRIDIAQIQPSPRCSMCSHGAGEECVWLAKSHYSFKRAGRLDLFLRRGAAGGRPAGRAGQPGSPLAPRSLARSHCRQPTNFYCDLREKRCSERAAAIECCQELRTSYIHQQKQC